MGNSSYRPFLRSLITTGLLGCACSLRCLTKDERQFGQVCIGGGDLAHDALCMSLGGVPATRRV